MKGHEQILAMREKGLMPEWVFLIDFPCPTDWADWGDHATVCVDGDKISALDLRFLVGCKVSISGTSERRCKALFEACKPYCESIAAGVTNMDEPLHKQTGWSELWQRTK